MTSITVLLEFDFNNCVQIVKKTRTLSFYVID